MTTTTKPKTYELCLRNIPANGREHIVASANEHKFLTVDAGSTQDMIDRLLCHVDLLKELQAAGFVAPDHDATFVTDDAELAQKFGFNESDPVKESIDLMISRDIIVSSLDEEKVKVWKYLYPEGWDTYASELAGEFTAEELQTALNKVSSEGRPSLSRFEKRLVEMAIELLEQSAIEDREDDLD